MQVEFKEAGVLLGVLNLEQVPEVKSEQPREMGMPEVPEVDKYVWSFHPTCAAWIEELPAGKAGASFAKGTSHKEVMSYVIMSLFTPDVLKPKEVVAER